MFSWEVFYLATIFTIKSTNKLAQMGATMYLSEYNVLPVKL
jgi:hypothetical protein